MAGPAAGMHDEQAPVLQLGGIAGGLDAAGPLLVVAPDAVAATRDRPAGQGISRLGRPGCRSPRSRRSSGLRALSPTGLRLASSRILNRYAWRDGIRRP